MAAEMARLGIEMGCFVVFGRERRPTFVRKDSEASEQILKQIGAALETAARVGGKWITTVCGYPDPELPVGLPVRKPDRPSPPLRRTRAGCRRDADGRIDQPESDAGSLYHQH